MLVYLRKFCFFAWMAPCLISCDSLNSGDMVSYTSYRNKIQVFEGSSYHVAYTILNNKIYDDSSPAKCVGVIRGGEIYDDYPYWHSFYTIRGNRVYENTSYRLLYIIRDDKIYEGSSYHLEYTLNFPEPPYPFSRSIGIYRDETDSTLVCSIRGGRVYHGGTDALIYTIRGNKVYKESSYSGADIVYTIADNIVYNGETGTVAYTIKEQNIYKGRSGDIEYVWR